MDVKNVKNVTDVMNVPNETDVMNVPNEMNGLNARGAWVSFPFSFWFSFSFIKRRYLYS